MPLNKTNPVKENAKSKSSDKKGEKKTHSKPNKKRKQKNRIYSSHSYSLLPKWKQLSKKTVTTLKNENIPYVIARGLDTIKRLQKAHKEIAEETPDQQKWKEAKKSKNVKQEKENKIARIIHRAIRRKKRAEENRKEELRSKKYRLDPRDNFHTYQPGYKKTRHRISKSLFVNCVDIPLFLEVLHANKGLMESPLWDDKLNLKNLSVEKAEQLKDHLYQFDILVEGLKAGLFNMNGCDDIPFGRVRRKRKPEKDTTHKQVHIQKESKKKKSLQDSNSDTRVKIIKRRMSYPPYEITDEEPLDDERTESWLSQIAKWAHPSKAATTTSPKSESFKTESTSQLQSSNVGDISSFVARFPGSEAFEETKKETGPRVIEHAHSKMSRGSFSPELRRQSVALTSDGFGDVVVEEEEEDGPFADFVTFEVPEEPSQKKKFINTLVEKKVPKKEKRKSMKSAGINALKQEEDAARRRHEHIEKLDPFQRLHDDDKDSDIWTKTSTTTTGGYASWRRPTDLKHTGNKQTILAHKVDTTFRWRVMLLLVIIWEIACFVKQNLDDTYYWIFSSHIFQENVWLFEPSLFAPGEKYIVLRIHEWSHVIISTISLSIIHRENECVSLLFAFSQTLDGLFEVAKSTHDYVYLPDPITWVSVGLTCFHIIWKVVVICFFIAYHYYSSGYIRKAREFKHRKTALHNHEIKAKGTKGIQKRKIAWSWMTQHARITQLRALKKKYPNIKDGNFTEENLAGEIWFSENKELRLYTQTHNLNLGFPYNRLHDMKRFVFSKLEKSDYSDKDDAEKEQDLRKKLRRMRRGSPRALTKRNLEMWKEKEEDKLHNFNSRVFTHENTHSVAVDKSHAIQRLTLNRKLSHNHFVKMLKR